MISNEWRIAAAAAALCCASAALAGPMILRASGPSAAQFKAGQRLADGQAVALKTGDVLVVLDPRGTRSVAGPGSFRFDTATVAGSAPTFAELLTQKSERRARIGAVRGGTGDATAPRPPGIWAIDAAAGGTVCVLDPTLVSLWRADTAQAQMVTLVRDTTRGEVPFAAGQPVAPWPATLPVADSATYKVGGFTKPGSLTVRVLAEKPSTIEALASALIEHGCTGQVERVARLTAVPG